MIEAAYIHLLQVIIQGVINSICTSSHCCSPPKVDDCWLRHKGQFIHQRLFNVKSAVEANGELRIDVQWEN